MRTAAEISAGYRALGDRITRAAGDPFYGLLSAADVQPFADRQLAGDFELRYPASVSVAVGATLTINGAAYRVVEDPQRIEDGREMVVRLVAA